MIFTDQRFALDDPVRRKILQGPNAAVRPHAGHQIRRDPARIETLGALIRDGLEGTRQVRLLDDGAHLRNTAVRAQEGLGRIRGTLQDLLLIANAPLQARIQRKTLAC